MDAKSTGRQIFCPLSSNWSSANFFKIINKEDIDFKVFFEYNLQSTRGHDLKLTKENCKRDTRKYFFSMRVINNWNNLPEDVVKAPTLNCFKNRLDRFMGDTMYTTRSAENWVQSIEGVPWAEPARDPVHRCKIKTGWLTRYVTTTCTLKKSYKYTYFNPI